MWPVYSEKCFTRLFNNAHFDPRSLLIVKKVLSIKNDLAAIKTTLRPDRSLLITLSWLQAAAAGTAWFVCVKMQVLVNTQWSLPACWATAAVTAPSPRDQAAAAGPAVGPGPPAVPVQPAATRPFGRRAVRKPATRPTSKSIYRSI